MGQTLLTINKLNKYYGDNVILKDFNLEVKKGDVIVVIGPSGCGKSTLLRCINGLEEVQSGTVKIDGEEINANSKNITRLRQKIGMVFQSYDLFPHKTVLENVLLAPLKVQKRERKEVEKEALKLLDKVGLADRKDDYPRQLSGGQKQRVAIIRALIMHPEVLLLDEITAALDPEMVHEVLEVVVSLAKSGSTMLIVTHEMAFARDVSNRVVFMSQGVICEEGSPAEVFGNPQKQETKNFLSRFRNA